MCVCVEQLCEVVSHTECVCVRRLGEVQAPSSLTRKCLIKMSMFLITLKSSSSAWKVKYFVIHLLLFPATHTHTSMHNI